MRPAPHLCAAESHTDGDSKLARKRRAQGIVAGVDAERLSRIEAIDRGYIGDGFFIQHVLGPEADFPSAAFTPQTRIEVQDPVGFSDIAAAFR